MISKKRDLWSWTGIWIVGVTAAVWSFSSLSDLAELVGIRQVIELWVVTVHVSWGLPITVDVLAVVATRVWLRGEAPAAAIAYAQRAAWAAVSASVIGNAYHGLLIGGRIDTVIISAVPAVVIGVLVHLAVLVGRPEKPTEQVTEELHSVPNPRAARDELAKQWIEENPDGGARRLAAHLTEQGHPLSPSGAASAYLKSAS